MLLSDKLKRIKEASAKNLSEESLKAIKASIEELRESGLVERALKVGHRAPEFALESGDGEIVSLASRLEKGPLVLTFYRGQW